MCAEWFGHFRQQEYRGAIDLVLLQETHVAVGEADNIDKLYHQTWGFVQEPGRTIYTEAAGPRGDVANLLHPYSPIRTLKPWQKDLWTRHWMVVRITQLGGVHPIHQCIRTNSQGGSGGLV